MNPDHVSILYDSISGITGADRTAYAGSQRELASKAAEWI